MGKLFQLVRNCCEIIANELLKSLYARNFIMLFIYLQSLTTEEGRGPDPPEKLQKYRVS